ncbi:hypothetical protein MLD38_011958 [Melastoma candidum]|uniref:Uncharacterized protein n=1 Tax=Melastoma candidum TaxID=119954 RepID=A0ACB9R5V3_9MYRT|nr:hypothetical protein MLD38_011958 [Melastoma candidum]
MAPTPASAKSSNTATVTTTPRTPHSKHRLNFHPSKPHPKDLDRPVEVVGRIRDSPDPARDPANNQNQGSLLQVIPENNTIRLRAEFGYRDFTLDGVSVSDDEDLDAFYDKFVRGRIMGVKLGDKCTVMMYGPTGSGKSHTMFGSAKQAGIVYRSLKDILGEGDLGGNEQGVGASGAFVRVTVLEIYNEEIYDLLSSASATGGFGIGWPKGSAAKVKLEVMGKKAKNATFISGNEAGKISREIQKVEKRRIVKSTLCNDRSSRSHCMIILDVPTVGGRLMLVDMAGSENIEQAGQVGFEAKMQTAKINQGNTALKRVVESIANGDSHVPFRDSKLTMLLQDSFEDDKSKILMILCASPDLKEIHKTISTLEYGAKAKCIVRGQHTPTKDKLGMDDPLAAEILGSRIAAMDQFIHKLQMENKIKEKERDEANKELLKKEEEVAALRERLQIVEGKALGASEEEVTMKVKERTEMLRKELEKKLEESQRMAQEFVEIERKRMEERMLQQQQEIEVLKKRLEEMEDRVPTTSNGMDFGDSFVRRLLGSLSAADDPGNMVKSMDLDMGDQESSALEIFGSSIGMVSNEICGSKLGDSLRLSTVFEEEEVGEDEDRKEVSFGDEEVEKVIIEEKRICSSTFSADQGPGTAYSTPCREDILKDRSDPIDEKDAASSRRKRIQTIFTLCGNHRELSQNVVMPPTEKEGYEDPSNKKEMEMGAAAKENLDPSDERTAAQLEVYVKWEASKENTGKFITTINVVKDATLADLRKLIEIFLAGDNQDFSFLILGDPSGAPVPKEKEATFLASKLPICNNPLRGHLACIRPAKGITSAEAMVYPLRRFRVLLPLLS